MDMHQPVPTVPKDGVDPGLTRYDPVANWVHRILWEAQQYRKRYDSQWEYFYLLYRSQHWPTRKINRGTGQWQVKLAINYIYSIIESVVAVMTDSHPKINIVPTSPEQQYYAANLQEAMDSIWYRRKAQLKIQDALKNAMIYGVGYLKVWWDPDLEGGKGDIEIGVPDPWSIFPDKRATSFEDCERVCEVRPVSLDYVRKHYPEKGHLVRPDSNYQGSFRYRKEVGSQPGQYGNFLSVPLVSPVDDNPLRIDQTEFSTPPYKSGQTASNETILIECWTKDDSEKVVQVPMITVDPMTGMRMTTIQEVKTRLYPHGRIIHVANGITLQDKPAPYYVWPYIRIVDNTLPGEFFGTGECEVLQHLQHELNKRRSDLVNHASLMGNAVWVVDKDAGIDRDELTNKPGAIIFKYRGAEVRRESPPQLPAWQMQMVEMTIRDMREISGIGPIPGGVVPRGIRSGAGFDSAQDIANTRIRLKVRNLEAALEDTGRVVVSLIQQFYTTPRMIRILGSAGDVAFVPFDGTHIRGDWDLRVGAGSTLPVSKSVQAQLALQLYGMQAIDQRALLEHVDFPDFEKILQRMGGPMPPEPRQGYPGWPGQPDPNRPNPSGYSLSIRSMPVPAMPPGPPGGMMPPQMPSVPPVGGGPIMHGGPTMQ